MQKKITVWKTKGMNRDLSVSAFNPEFSFENRNLRLSTNDGNTMLSWVNEKGTQELDVDIIINTWASASDDSVQTEEVVGGSPRRPVRRRRENNIIGTPIGKAILNDQLVLFTTTSDGTDEQPVSNTNAVQKHDFIYVLKYADSTNKIEGFLLYNGNLNFNPNYPLETIVSYEAEYIQKVYWTDGYNQPRIVNIKADDEHLMLWNTTSGTNIDTFFDFVPSLSLQEDVTITKAAESEGLFAPGIIQYCFSYINKYSQQSNLAYVSPLYYLSHKDRGASPEEKVTNSFKITIDNIDHNFDYIRLYSIQRTSLNANPIVKLVQDIKLPPQYYVDLVYAEEGEGLTIPLERVVETEEGQEPTVEFKGIKGAEIDGKDFFEVISPITLEEDVAAEWKNSESISFTAYNETTEIQEEASITMTDLIKELLNNVSLYSNSYTLDRFYAILTIDNNVNNFLQAMAQPQSQSQDTYGWGLTVGEDFYPGKELFYNDGAERTAKNLSFVYNYNNSTWYIVDSIDKIQVPDVENTVSFIDNGTTGSTVDSYELLYIGGHEITALTMAEKDNTLFLGNINQPSSNVLSIQDYFDNIRDTENECTISFDYLPEKVSQGNIVKGVYDYKHALDEGNSYNITTFKGGDTYRFGIQFQKATGEWSIPIFLNDVKNTLYPKTYYSRDGYSLIGAKATINIGDMLANIQSSIPDFIKKYKKVRPVIVYPNYADRTVLCQGVVNPTVFNIRDRIEKGVFSQSSWFYRPYCNGDNTRQDQTVGDRSTVWGYAPYWGEPSATGTKYFTVVLVPYLSYITYGDKFSIMVSGTYRTYRDPISFGPEYIDFDSAIYLGKDSNSDYEYYALVSDKSFSTLMEEMEDKYYVRYNRPANWRWNPVVESDVEIKYYSVIGAAIDANLHVNPVSHLYYYDSPSVELTEEPQILDLVFYTPVEGAQFSNWKHIVTFTDTTEASTSVSDGVAINYRHYSPLSNSHNDLQVISRKAEIMCAPNEEDIIPIYTDTPIELSEKNSNSDFYVDQSIITLNSPDLEFGEDLQWYSQNNLKLRIVGIIPITSNSSKYNIETSSPMMELYHNVNFNISEADNKIEHFTGKGNISDIKTVSNIGIYAGRRLCSDYLWDDVFTTWKDIDSEDKDNKDNICNRGFVVYGVYPWHRNGPLNNDFRNKTYASSWLSTKVLSNMYYSYNTEYFSSTNSGNEVHDVEFSNINCKYHLYDNTQIYNIRMSEQGEGLSQIDYYPNIDKVLYNKDGYSLTMDLSYTNPRPRSFTATPPYTTLSTENEGGNKWISFGRYNNLYDGNYAYDKQFSVYSPVSMKYKSGTHAIISFRKDSNNNIPILPYGSVKVNNHIYNLGKYTHTGNIYDTSWGDKNVRFTQEGINVFDLENNSTDFLWLAELYQDIDDSTRFGGRSIQALQENKWLPCGESVALQDSEGSIKDEVTLKWLQGDTYYQRYDSLKTVPFTKEDQNQIVEILSFMCETRYNICGRYDANRGQLDNSVMTPENFNKLNPVYSQANNFFTYKIIETEDEDKSSYPNSITYTKTKTAGATEDLYTNITLASMLEMDGDKGKVNSIIRLNDNLISFQDTGIAQILYNENVQINSTQGVPIEIANSGKVQGKRYLSDTVGCSNKWSIVTTPQGVYFFDSVSKDIYAFDGQLTNVSLNKGLHSWVFNSIPADVWNPATFTGCVSYYDPINQEVLFITSTSCISYSLKLQEFTSFYDYYNAPYLCTVKDKNLWVSKSRASQSSLYKIWRHNAGDYCKFFGEPAPYSVTLIGNPDPQLDKIFTNMEMRAIVEGDGEYDETEDTFTPTLPFSSLETWNDYQHGIANLVTSNGMKHHTSDRNGSLLRKFRMWRCDIPRDNVDVNAVTENPMGIFRKAKHPLDRMRNPWLYLKLKKDAQANMPKVELHDFLMTYFE